MQQQLLKFETACNEVERKMLCSVVQTENLKKKVLTLRESRMGDKDDTFEGQISVLAQKSCTGDPWTPKNRFAVKMPSGQLERPGTPNKLSIL